MEVLLASLSDEGRRAGARSLLTAALVKMAAASLTCSDTLVSSQVLEICSYRSSNREANG